MWSRDSGKTICMEQGELICFTEWPEVGRQKSIWRWFALWSGREGRQSFWFRRSHWPIRQWCGFTAVSATEFLSWTQDCLPENVTIRWCVQRGARSMWWSDHVLHFLLHFRIWGWSLLMKNMNQPTRVSRCHAIMQEKWQSIGQK